jgi:hypothetical protein
MATRTAHHRNGISRLARIAELPLPPLEAPPVNPTVEEAMQAWIAMARAYGSIVTRQHEFENIVIDVLRDIEGDVRKLAEDVVGLKTAVSLLGDEPATTLVET